MYISLKYLLFWSGGTITLVVASLLRPRWVQVVLTARAASLQRPGSQRVPTADPELLADLSPRSFG